MAKTFQEGKLYDIPVAQIVLGEQLIRHDPNDDDIIELAASITEQTLLEPVGFTVVFPDTYQLLYGSRRLAAFKRLKRATIPAIYKTAETQQVKAIAIVENLQRRNLTLSEEVDAITFLHEQQSLTPDQIATRLSKSRAWVLRRLAIPQIPEDLRDPLLEGRISLGQAEELSYLESEGVRAYATQQVIQAKHSQSQTRDLVQALQAVSTQEEAINAGVAISREPVTASEPSLSCQSCSKKRKISDLIVVRICRDGCIHQPADQHEPTTH